MNHLQEWALRYVLGREGDGQKTKGKDLFEASFSGTPQDIHELVDWGFLSLEQTNRIPANRNVIGSSTFVILTDKGKEYFKH